MRLVTLTASLSLSVALLAGAAAAQEQPAQPKNIPTPGQSAADAARGNGIDRATLARSAAADLIGRTVKSARGDTVGEVHDAIVDGRAGTLVALIVETDSSLGNEPMLVQLPFEDVELHASGSTVVSKIAPASLLKLPKWSYEQLNQQEVVALRDPRQGGRSGSSSR